MKFLRGLFSCWRRQPAPSVPISDSSSEDDSEEQPPFFENRPNPDITEDGYCTVLLFLIPNSRFGILSDDELAHVLSYLPGTHKWPKLGPFAGEFYVLSRNITTG